MTGGGKIFTEPKLRELAARGAAELKGASATDLLRWTDENFGGVNGPRGAATCNYVVASSMQDAVLIDLAAKVRPGVPVLFLDTDYTSPKPLAPATRPRPSSMCSTSPRSTRWPNKTNC